MFSILCLPRFDPERNVFKIKKTQSQAHMQWSATLTQESIFIGLIGFSRSKFQDFEARILVLTSS